MYVCGLKNVHLIINVLFSSESVSPWRVTDLLSFCETAPSTSLATVLEMPIRPTRKLPC